MDFFRRIPPWLGHSVRIGLGIAVIFALIHTHALNPRLLGDAIKKHWGYYGMAVLLYMGVLEILAYLRWLWLLRVARVSISAWEVFRLHVIGLFFSGFLPGGTGGDLVKGYYLLRGRSKTEGAAALGTMVVDRFAGTFGLILLGTITNFMNISMWRDSRTLALQSIFVLSLAAVTVLLIGLFLSLWRPAQENVHYSDDKTKPVRGFIMEFLKDVVTFRDAPKVFLGAIGISMLVHLTLIGVYSLCSQALDVPLPFRLQAYVVPTLTLLNGIPISIAGLGIGEEGGKYLYAAIGVTDHRGSDIPALVHTIVFLTTFVCAPMYLFSRWNEKPVPKGAAESKEITETADASEATKSAQDLPY
jgi:hypothetical protein